MRTALRKDEILKSICQHLTRIDRGFSTLIALARTSKSLKETPLDVLWGTGAVSLTDALKTLPPDSWSATKDSFTLERKITPNELFQLRQYTKRITNLQVGGGKGFETFSTLIIQYGSPHLHKLWPKVEILWWTAPSEHLHFLQFFLTPSVRNLMVNLEKSEDEVFRETLCLIESRCVHLKQLRLFDSETRENKDLQRIIRQILSKNARTLRVFMPPQDPSAPLVSDILQLPSLQELVMHVPQIPQRLPSRILPCLRSLLFSLDHPLDILDLLHTLRKSRLINFTLNCPYPTSQADQIALAHFFRTSGLYDSLKFLVWEPPSNGSAFTWQFVTILRPFANLQALQLELNCHTACQFEFGHDDVVQISKWMPRLRELIFGGSPCPTGGTFTDIGYHTLAVVAKNCPYLYSLAVHFDIRTIGPVRWRVQPNPNVTFWDVGTTVLPSNPELRTFIALAVVKLFPKVTITGKASDQWSDISEEIEYMRLPPVHWPSG
ncbi:hypothetical protein BJ322DRAFT_1194215 [Thelephora terrestris]|uniref:F-box domain-containing protein n=1 Tax=Thelephora terrestris TaxID=56493 RepID=A0A9P6L7G5_9AGAM|nr:hypothetical protein BJ322DRAFT_1194215 [Thelephora terrestris]